MRIKYLCFFSIYLALLSSGCYILEPEGPVNDVLQPLAVGNWWEYEFLRPGWTNPHQGIVHTIVSEQIEVVVDGKTYTAWTWHDEQDHLIMWLRRNGENGIYLMGGISDTDTLFTNELHYKYPARAGESWEFPLLVYDYTTNSFQISGTRKIKLIDNNRIVQTPAGDFRCYVYYFRISMGEDVPGGFFGYYQFYSPGVGLVVMEEWGESDSWPEENRVLSKLALIDYHLLE